PDPDGPMIAVNEPLGSPMLIPSSATTDPSPWPWTLRTSRRATAGAVRAPGSARTAGARTTGSALDAAAVAIVLAVMSILLGGLRTWRRLPVGERLDHGAGRRLEGSDRDRSRCGWPPERYGQPYGSKLGRARESCTWPRPF